MAHLRIALLIQEAVKKSLRFKLLALDTEEVASATKEEFLRLLKSNEALEKEHDELKSLKAQAEQQIDDLRLELNKQNDLLEEKLVSAEDENRARYDGEDLDIAERINVLITGLTESGKADEVPARVMELVMSIVHDERRQTIEAEEAVRDKEVVNLRRRIEKLNASLEQTESRLSDVAALKHVDQGISSVFREVQGLDAEDREFEAKSNLMESIFEANLRLQGK